MPKSKQKRTKKTQTTPNIESSNQQLKEAILTWKQGYHQKKAADNLIDRSKQVIIPIAEGLRLTYCRDNDIFYKSFIINNEIKITIPIQYSKLPLSLYDKLSNEFGHNVNIYFKTCITLELTNKALSNPLFLNKLVNYCGGKEKFKELFKINKELKPTDNYHIDRIMNARIAAINSKLKNKGIIEQKGVRIHII